MKAMKSMKGQRTKLKADPSRERSDRRERK